MLNNFLVVLKKKKCLLFYSTFLKSKINNIISILKKMIFTNVRYLLTKYF